MKGYPAVSCLLSSAFHDPATPQDFVASIENGRLTRSDSALRFVERDARAIVRQGSDRSRRGCMTIPDAHFRDERFCRIVEGNPIHATSCEFVAQQLVLIANDDAVLCRFDSNNVKRLRICDPETAALTYRVMMKSRVRSDHLSMARDNDSRFRQTIGLFLGLEISIDEARVIAVGNKTDFLRFFLFSNSEIVPPCGRARIGL